MRYSLRVLLIRVIVTWLTVVVGALGGALAAGQHLSGTFIPNSGYLRLGLSFGGVLGLIPAGVSAAVTLEYGAASGTFGRWWLASWVALAVASGVGFYWLAVITANI